MSTTTNHSANPAVLPNAASTILYWSDDIYTPDSRWSTSASDFATELYSYLVKTLMWSIFSPMFSTEAGLAGTHSVDTSKTWAQQTWWSTWKARYQTYALADGCTQAQVDALTDDEYLYAFVCSLKYPCGVGRFKLELTKLNFIDAYDKFDTTGVIWGYANTNYYRPSNPTDSSFTSVEETNPRKYAYYKWWTKANTPATLMQTIEDLVSEFVSNYEFKGRGFTGRGTARHGGTDLFKNGINAIGIHENTLGNSDDLEYIAQHRKHNLVAYRPTDKIGVYRPVQVVSTSTDSTTGAITDKTVNCPWIDAWELANQPDGGALGNQDRYFPANAAFATINISPSATNTASGMLAYLRCLSTPLVVTQSGDYKTYTIDLTAAAAYVGDWVSAVRVNDIDYPGETVTTPFKPSVSAYFLEQIATFCGTSWKSYKLHPRRVCMKAQAKSVPAGQTATGQNVTDTCYSATEDIAVANLAEASCGRILSNNA